MGFLTGTSGLASGASGPQAMGGLAATPGTGAGGTAGQIAGALPNPMANTLNSTMNQYQTNPNGLQYPTTAAQANLGYNQAQNSIAQQQNFLSALGAQGGIGNQSNVYNQQQALANQLGQMAQGQGPNPAQAMLNQATGQNVANQSAMMASNRGASANAGLIARQAAQQGAATQQQAVGQGATMQAQQQLAAIGALQNQQNSMGNLATQQVNQQGTAQNALNQATQNEQANLLSSINAQNQANLGYQGLGAQISGQNAQNNAGIVGGLMNSVGGIAGMLHEGGVVEHYDGGGYIGVSQVAPASIPSLLSNVNPYAKSSGSGKSKSQSSDNAPKSVAGQYLQEGGTAPVSGAAAGSAFGAVDAPDTEGAGTGAMAGQMSGFMAKGGKVPAMVSPGEIYLPPDKAKKVAEGKGSPDEGRRIPGKAKVKGDSLKNDTVPAKLEEGGVVIPRSVLQSDKPIDNAMKFVHAHMTKHNLRMKRK
jgi:hypothetical protein